MSKPVEDDRRAHEEGFFSVENMFELEGAWSYGCCCFEHMVEYLDTIEYLDAGADRPVVRYEACYVSEKAKQALRRRENIEAATRSTRSHFQPSRKQPRRLREAPPQKRLHETFKLTGQNLLQTVVRHQDNMRVSGLRVQ